MLSIHVTVDYAESRHSVTFLTIPETFNKVFSLAISLDRALLYWIEDFQHLIWPIRLVVDYLI